MDPDDGNEETGRGRPEKSGTEGATAEAARRSIWKRSWVDAEAPEAVEKNP